MYYNIPTKLTMNTLLDYIPKYHEGGCVTMFWRKISSQRWKQGREIRHVIQKCKQSQIRTGG